MLERGKSKTWWDSVISDEIRKVMMGRDGTLQRRQ